MFPVILSYTKTAGVNIMPFVVIIAHAAMSGLMTPYGAPVMLVIAATGQYTPIDFAKFGFLISVFFAVVSAVATAAVYDMW
jgi:di/tricarboxylate transporter